LLPSAHFERNKTTIEIITAMIRRQPLFENKKFRPPFTNDQAIKRKNATAPTKNKKPSTLIF